MNKKRDALALFFIVCLSATFLIFAADNETNVSSGNTSVNLGGFEKGYSCLKEQVTQRGYNAMIVEELAFSLLALGYDSEKQDKLKSALDALGSSGECWPKTGCTLRDTSLVLLAYNHISQDTGKIEKWLLNKTASATDLVWYLQIDNLNNNKTKCTITYDAVAKSASISENKVITGNLGACLKSAQNGYWLEVDAKCYGKTFDISCDDDFLTSVFYKKKTEPIYYITAMSHVAAPNGKTSETIESLCFLQMGSCNYEGSLWATYALNKIGKDRNPFLPYLIALSKDNQRYLPSSFLYSITGFDEYFIELTGKQDKKGYWRIAEASRTYYDTALALLALAGSSTEQADKAVQYLLEPTVQATSGCWNGNSIRDTAFVLYAASPKPASTPSPRTQCNAVSSYSCTSSTECERINGSVLADYNCWGGDICCDKKVSEKTCSEKDGKVCLSSQECSAGGFVSASGTSYCCLGDCIEKEDEEDACTIAGDRYICRDAQCTEDEEEQFLTCPENGVCCAPMLKEEKSYWWLWLLVILIILIALAMVFRNQLKIWWFKFKNKFKKGPITPQNRPPVPPSSGIAFRSGSGMLPQRPPMLGRPMPPRPAPRTFGKEKELDETLKKLRDMSK